MFKYLAKYCQATILKQKPSISKDFYVYLLQNHPEFLFHPVFEKEYHKREAINVLVERAFTTPDVYHQPSTLRVRDIDIWCLTHHFIRTLANNRPVITYLRAFERILPNDTRLQIETYISYYFYACLVTNAIIFHPCYQLADSDIECSICMENICDAQLVCGHRFCCDCITEWSNRAKVCPICRQQLKKEINIGELMRRHINEDYNFVISLPHLEDTDCQFILFQVNRFRDTINQIIYS